MRIERCLIGLGILMVSVLVIAIFVQFTSISTPQVMWSFETEGHILETVAVGDISGDGCCDVVITCSDNKTYAVDGNDGSLIWTFEADGVFAHGAALGNLIGDEVLEVVVASRDGQIYALEGSDGALLWNYSTFSNPGAPCIGDTNGDAEPDVVFFSGGYVYSIRGSDGVLHWDYHIGKTAVTTLGDIDHDDVLDVVLGITTHAPIECEVQLLSGFNGTLISSYSIDNPDFAASTVRTLMPALSDVNEDDVVDIIVTTDEVNVDNVYAIDGNNGSVLWSFHTEWWSASLPAIADVDGDLELEVIVSSSGSWVYVLDALDGELEWKSQFEYVRGVGHISTTICDIDGDGGLDLLVPGYNGVYGLRGRDGSLTWTFGDRIHHSSTEVAVGDLDGNGPFEVIVVDGHQNTTYALRTLTAGQRVYWVGRHGDPEYSGIRSLDSIDPDIDMLSTYSENIFGTDPHEMDSDYDIMPDEWEVLHGLEPLNDDSAEDPDNDGVSNLDEYLNGKLPEIPDSVQYFMLVSVTGIVSIVALSATVGWLLLQRAREG